MTHPAVEVVDDQGLEVLPADATVVNVGSHMTVWPPEAFFAEQRAVPGALVSHDSYDMDGLPGPPEVETVACAWVPEGVRQSHLQDPDAAPPAYG